MEDGGGNRLAIAILHVQGFVDSLIRILFLDKKPKPPLVGVHRLRIRPANLGMPCSKMLGFELPGGGGLSKLPEAAGSPDKTGMTEPLHRATRTN
ncbi:hypothetical protein PGT21_036210 [Puccinia graminis f. sp. tritici]|nr:hypothetical protein PGT21_036210 [Puccinia graminis f. sp. tritici]